MGMFMAASAFRDHPPASVGDAIKSACAKPGLRSEVLRGNGAGNDLSRDAFVYPQRRWSVVLWPDAFRIHDVPLCQAVSGELKCVASTVHVHDGSYWAHVLLSNGQVADRFASVPDYFPEQNAIHSELRSKYAGYPAVLARTLGCSEGELKPYLVHGAPNSEPSGTKAHLDDEFELEDVWVFTDFWKRLGIEYPEDMASYALKVRFQGDFSAKLPTEGPGFL